MTLYFPFPKKFFIYDISNKETFNILLIILYSYGIDGTKVITKFFPCFIYVDLTDNIPFISSLRTSEYSVNKLQEYGYTQISIEDILKL